MIVILILIVPVEQPRHDNQPPQQEHQQPQHQEEEQPQHYRLETVLISVMILVTIQAVAGYGTAQAVGWILVQITVQPIDVVAVVVLQPQHQHEQQPQQKQPQRQHEQQPQQKQPQHHHPQPQSVLISSKEGVKIIHTVNGILCLETGKCIK
jgi:hypothetical protein